MSLVVDIEKHYGTFDLEVAFEAAHETLGFLGASGCGKSLTLRCIAGVETPDAGKIVVNGKTYFDKAPGKKASVNLSAQERKSALLFQNYQLFPNLTVKANIAAGIPREVLKRNGDAASRAGEALPPAAFRWSAATRGARAHARRPARDPHARRTVLCSRCALEERA